MLFFVYIEVVINTFHLFNVHNSPSNIAILVLENYTLPEIYSIQLCTTDDKTYPLNRCENFNDEIGFNNIDDYDLGKELRFSYNKQQNVFFYNKYIPASCKSGNIIINDERSIIAEFNSVNLDIKNQISSTVKIFEVNVFEEHVESINPIIIANDIIEDQHEDINPDEIVYVEQTHSESSSLESKFEEETKKIEPDYESTELFEDDTNSVNTTETNENTETNDDTLETVEDEKKTSKMNIIKKSALVSTGISVGAGAVYFLYKNRDIFS
ncbi:putative SP-containing protein [Vairimorpha necatrix]|uniref:SP-containing protein n=1 Tax=Vairimorpha necatrix TaxID=6039 RepID=A0AAX4JCZ7_9MICR